VDGVSIVETDYSAHTARITFDDEKTDVEAMKKALGEQQFSVEGEPRFLK
jgi:copper chaperone CopZ